MQINDNALHIITTLKHNGFEAVLAGGCVRDMLLGREPNDWDIATNAVPDKVEELFPDTLPVGKAFGVIIVFVNGEQFEVATFRADKFSAESDGRRPDAVVFGDMEADAKRRDFTVNGLFFDPVSETTHDFVGGVSDLHKETLRFIGDPDTRIEEDALRLLRAIRFYGNLGFVLDRAARHALVENTDKIHRISKERVRDELLKILRSTELGIALRLLQISGLLREILPEVNNMYGCTQPEDFHPEGDVFIHTIKVLENLPQDASDELLWAALLHDVGKPPTRTVEDRIRFNKHHLVGADLTQDILRRLKMPNDTIDQVASLVKNHMRWMCVKDMRKSKLKRFMQLDNFDDHKALHRADCMASHENLSNLEFVENTNFPPEEIRPEPIIRGQNLIDLGFKPGPLFKEILTAVEDAQLEGDITDKEKALEFVREHYSIV